MWTSRRILFQQRRHIFAATTSSVAAAGYAWYQFEHDLPPTTIVEKEDEQDSILTTTAANQQSSPSGGSSAPSAASKETPLASLPHLMLLPNNPHTSFCDAAFAPSSSSFFGGASNSSDSEDVRLLQRQRTVQGLLHQTASGPISKLEQTYQVYFDQEPLGVGTFGTVYKGHDLETLEPVAVKTVSKRFLVQTDSTESLLRELSVLLHLQRTGSGHPSICLLRQHFEEERNTNDNADDVWYHLVFDLVQGGELFDQLAQHGAYSEADAARLIRQVASALVVLHSQDIVHCDLKPENLMLSSTDKQQATIKIVDFGCAHMPADDALQQPHEGNGGENHLPDIPAQQRYQGTGLTPAYCPPEVLRRTRLLKPGDEAVKPDASYDMWSLGVILYILLTGAHPFDLKGRSTSEEMEEKILSNDKLPIRKSRFTRHLSDDAKDLLEGLMQRDPQKRLTAEQLLENPWVQGTTASSNIMTGSDRRLAEYRRHETKIGSSIFKGLVSQATSSHYQSSTSATGGHVSDFAKRTSILEMAFRDLDPKGKGYISTKELNNREGGGSSSAFSFLERDAKLSMAEVQQLLSENMVSKHLKKGQTVYHEGDSGTAMYFLHSGTVQVTSKDGFRTTRQAGEFFGEDALLRKNDDSLEVNGRHRHSVQCLTPVQVLEISREYFDKYLKADRDVELTMEETDRLRHREQAKVLFGLQKDLKPKTFSRGDVIFKEGSSGNLLYIMDQGKVDITVEGRKVRSLVEGEMTGEHAAFYHHKPYNVTAECLSNKCTMQVLDGSKIRQLCQEHSKLNDAFKDIILRRDFKKAVVKATQQDFPQGDQELQDVFQLLLDKDGGSNNDERGVNEIHFETLKQFVKQWDPEYSDENIRDMLRSLDLNNLGTLTWDEFKRIFSMFNES